MHSDCIEELDLEDNWIGDMAGREILEALEHRKEGGWGVDRGHGGQGDP